jgi:hypothetical protein
VSAKRGLAVLAAPPDRTGVSATERLHLPATQRAWGRAVSGEPLPHPGYELIQGGLAAQVAKQRWGEGQGAHEMFLISPTTRPRTRTSRLRIGSMVAFSG